MARAEDPRTDSALENSLASAAVLDQEQVQGETQGRDVPTRGKGDSESPLLVCNNSDNYPVPG